MSLVNYFVTLGSPLTSEQLTELTSYTLRSGEPILTQEDMPFVYEFSALLRYYSNISQAKLYNYLTNLFSRPWNRRSDILFSLPFMKTQVNKEVEELDSYRRESKDDEGLFQCRCGSRRTVASQVQTRAADEPMTTIVKCQECNRTWKQ